MKLSKVLAVLFPLAFLLPSVAQTAARLHAVPQIDRVRPDADMGARQTLSSHMPSWAAPANRLSDEVDSTKPLRMTIVMKRAPAVQTAFEQLLADQQNPAAPMYHHWLKPAEVGELFGPTQHDVQAVAAWAQAQGLILDSIAPSRMAIELSGVPSIVAGAFRTSFHMYRFGGRARRATSSEPSIPAPLAAVVDTVHGFIDDEPIPTGHGVSVKQDAQPAFTGASGINHYIAPNDFSTIYDLKALPSTLTGATIAGASQHIAIIDESDVVLSDITDFATKTALGAYKLNTLVPNGDPGVVSSLQIESTLDVDRVIGTAPGATADLVVVGTGAGGIYAGASYAVNTLSDPVLTMSFSSCEQVGGQSTVNQWNTLWTTAASEGISVFISAGDAGADECEPHNVVPPASQSLHVNAICSSQYATCVGGTEFSDAASAATYWSSTNGTSLGSALSYIPEGAWNEPGTAAGTGTFVVLAGGGGVSIFTPKPTWQTGTGVPADGFRDTPDVSFSSSAHDGYYGCFNLNCESGSFEYFYGTSAAAPAMAGIAALLNMAAGTRQGNLNPLIYRLANSPASSVIFHDATIASSGVTNCTVNSASMCNNSTPSEYSLTGGQPGYLLTAGYDQATGWGSLDVAKFITAAIPVSTTLSIKASYTQITTTQSTTATVTLTPASTSVAGPSGTVQFYSNGAALGAPVTLANDTASTATLTFPTVGNYILTAVYSGDSYYTGSSSASAVVTVGLLPPSFTLTSTTSSLSFTSGAASGNQAPLTLTSVNSYGGSVAFTCTISESTAAAPYPPSCSVSPGSVTLAANATTALTVTVSSTTLVSSLEPVRPLSERSPALALACGVLGLFALRSWRKRPLLFAMVLLGLIAAPIGCGGGHSAVKGSSAGSYTMVVAASGTSAGAPAASFATSTFSVMIN